MSFLLGFIATALASARKGWQHVKPYVTLKNALYLIGLVGFLTGVILIYRACNNPPKVQLNEKELHQVKQAIETQERKELEEAYVLVEVKQEEINANVASGRTETVNKAAEARKEAQGMTIEQLEAYLEGMAKQ